MALQKEIIFDNGAVATYHKINSININFNDTIMLPTINNTPSGSIYVGVNVSSYKDEAWRAEKPNNAVHGVFYNLIVASESIDSINRELLYNKLKENNTFSCSLDV